MVKERKVAIVTIILLVLIVLAGAFVIYELKSPSGYYARKNADIQKIEQNVLPYTDLEGNQTNIEDFVGKPLVINAWASWSPYSKSDFQILSALKKEYGDQVTILAMNRLETKETANAYLDFIGREDGLVYLVDTGDHFFKTVEGYAMPETLFYDSIGNIVSHKRGSLTGEEAKSYLEAVLEADRNR